jgi:hypothetical protein
MYSATWIGVDGWGDSSLIQTGTSQDTSDGYYAWWEILPAAETVITKDVHGNPAPVKPGDHIVADVQETSPGMWTIYLEDVTQNWYFQQNNNPYSGPGSSAEWIEEAPDVNGSTATLANFGTVAFSRTGVYGSFGPSGTTWYGTNMSAADEIDMYDSTGSILLAAPSAPTSDPSLGQDFTDTYDGPSAPPPQGPVVTVSSPSNAYQLSRTIHIDYSATDPTSPVAYYDVRYSVFPWNSPSAGSYRYPGSWNRTKSKELTLYGTPGDAYCFSVRAVAASGASSSWTNNACASLPLGERSLHEVVGGQWSRHRAVGYYLHGYAKSTINGATIEAIGATANQVAVVATKCPTCGTFDVLVNGTLEGSYNTYAARTQRSTFFVTPTFPLGRVTVQIEDVSKSGKVIIEGLGVG